MTSSEPEKLRRKDYHLIAICALICAGSLTIGFRYFSRAFPEASIQFNVNRDSSEPAARSFLAAQGLSTEGYRHAAAFVYDDEAKVFLERELGLKRANEVMRSDVRIWRWGHRWFLPQQKEEIRIEVATSGEITAFFHVLPEEAPGANLSPEAARILAETFLAAQAMRPTEKLEFLDAAIQRRNYRTDHVFTWKVRSADYSGASHRISVTVQGGRVDGYNESLKIPEDWSRSYARLRSLNESAVEVDLVFFALLGIAMLVMMGKRARLRDVNWKIALTFGSICFMLQFLAAMNEFPQTEFGFDTADSYGAFLGFSILSALVEASAYGGIIALLTAAVEPQYRHSYPSHLSISKILNWSAWRTRGFFRASMVGITLCFFFFAFEIGFYLLANRLGAWAPAEVPYSNMLNTQFPWIFVLLSGFFPAVSEEWMFRAFSIPFLQNLLRRRWLVLALASFIWGFGHANYPNQPFYIRGIEVGLVGLVLSWAMLRFGILAPLIAHYSIDAFYSAFLLLRSGNSYLTLSGALTAGITLIPLLIAAGAYLVTRRFRPDSSVCNAAVQPTLAQAEPDEFLPSHAMPAYRLISRKARWIAPAVAAIGILTIYFRPPHFGTESEFRLSRTQAAQSARRFLSTQQSSLENFEDATQPIVRTSSFTSQYIYQEAGIDGLNRMYSRETVPLAWQTRFFKPLDQEEYSVDVDPTNGRILGFTHFLPEETPGADLPAQNAQELASDFLKEQGCNLSGFELQETRSAKLEHRRDTALVWQALPGSAGAVAEARVRLRTAVAGDRISSWTSSIKIPEEWERARLRFSGHTIAAILSRGFFLSLMFAAAIWILVKGIRQGIIQWKTAAQSALLVTLLELVYMIDLIPFFAFRYDTQITRPIFILSGIVEGALRLLGIGLAGGLAAALLMSCFPDISSLFRRKNRALWGRDAFTSAAAALGAYLLLQWGTGLVEYREFRYGLAPELTVNSGIGGFLPLVAGLRNILLSALLFSTVLGFFAFIWSRLAGRPWLRAFLIAGLCASFLPFEARRFSEVALEAGMALALVGMAVALLVVYLRNNYASYFLATAVLSTARETSSFLGQGNALLEFQGWLLWLIVLGGALLLFPIQRRNPLLAEAH
jgi:membrane protease YdiL (CAAX protease family)